MTIESGLLSLDSSVFVHLAATCYVVGLAVRKELVLRNCILAGTVFYILYYWLYPHEPLWGAIVWSVILGTVNICVILRIIYEHKAMDRHSLAEPLLAQFGGLEKAKLHQLAQIGEHHDVGSRSRTLTTEGVRPDDVYLITRGEAWVEKNGVKVRYGAGSFVGEISFVLQRPATATVEIAPFSAYLSFNQEMLRRLLARCPATERAFASKVNLDIAEKLARAFQIDSAPSLTTKAVSGR